MSNKRFCYKLQLQKLYNQLRLEFIKNSRLQRSWNKDELNDKLMELLECAEDFRINYNKVIKNINLDKLQDYTYGDLSLFIESFLSVDQ